MRGPSFSALLFILAAASALALGGCGGTEYAGVELSRYVPGEYLDGVAASLERAGQNGPELLDAITRAPESDREALAFLVANLPSVDLATATADFLLETVRSTEGRLATRNARASLSPTSLRSTSPRPPRTSSLKRSALAEKRVSGSRGVRLCHTTSISTTCLPRECHKNAWKTGGVTCSKS